jgi:hypothetical protein
MPRPEYARGILNQLTNVIDHQVVYRRVTTDFTLDMNVYYRSLADQQLARLEMARVWTAGMSDGEIGSRYRRVPTAYRASR